MSGLESTLSTFATKKSQSDANIELEIRFRAITREAFDAIVTGLAAKFPATPEYTINFLSSDVSAAYRNNRHEDAKHIKTVFIEPLAGGWKAVGKPDHVDKSRLAKPQAVNAYLPYTININAERTTADMPTAHNALVRFKARLGFTAGNWRYDLTAIDQIPMKEISEAAALRERTGKFFSDMGVAKSSPADAPGKSVHAAKAFLDALPRDRINKYEVEIEWIGQGQPVAADFDVVKEVFAAVNPDYATEGIYQDAIYEVAKMIMKSGDAEAFKNPDNRLKRLANQVVAVTKNIYGQDIWPKITSCWLMQKWDGLRFIAVVRGGGARLLFSDKVEEVGKYDHSAVATVLDCEVVGTGANRFAKVFDVIALDGRVVAAEPFNVVQTMFEKGAAELTSAGLRAVSGDPIFAENPEEAFRAISTRSPKFADGTAVPLDGIIIVAPTGGYRDRKNYKWKPVEQTTIDFLAIRCPQKLLGVSPYEKRPGHTLHLLMCGVSRAQRARIGLGVIPYQREVFECSGDYHPVQFSPSAAPLAYLYWHPESAGEIHQRIVELGPKMTAATAKSGPAFALPPIGQLVEWTLHKIRDDRKLEKTYFGNDFRVAENIFSNFIDPFPLEQLWTKPAGYFGATVDKTYHAANKFRRFCVSNVMSDNFRGIDRMLDLAAGRGSELGRCQELGIKTTLFVDIDPTAIAELVERKYNFFAQKKSFVRGRTGGAGGDAVSRYVDYDRIIERDLKAMVVHTLVADLSKPASESVAAFMQFGYRPETVDGIICNFAFHYFCNSAEGLVNICGLISQMLKIGGVFFMIVMDGERIFEALKGRSRGESYDLFDADALTQTPKYSLRRLYDGDTIAPTGQKIAVKLPFADEMYEEPLCNTSAVIGAMEKFGMKVEVNTHIDKMLPQFMKMFGQLGASLTPADVEYIKFFKCMTFRSVAKKAGGRSALKIAGRSRAK